MFMILPSNVWKKEIDFIFFESQTRNLAGKF